jgi:hypothetical protein
MKLSSLFSGDIADLLQDSRIGDVEAIANAASSMATINGSRIARLSHTVEQRLTEIETENALLGRIVVRLLASLAEKDKASVDTLLEEVRSELTSGKPAPQGLDFLTKLLEVPSIKKTPIANYARPLTLPIKPPSFAVSAPTVAKAKE